MQNCFHCYSPLKMHYTDRNDDEIPVDEQAETHSYECGTTVLTMLLTGEQKRNISRECIINDLANDIDKLLPVPQPIQMVLNEAAQWLQSARQPGVQPATNLVGLTTNIGDWHQILLGLHHKINQLRNESYEN